DIPFDSEVRSVVAARACELRNRDIGGGRPTPGRGPPETTSGRSSIRVTTRPRRRRALGRSMPRSRDLHRRKAVEPSRILDQYFLSDLRLGCPLRQLVDLCTVVAHMRWRNILAGLAAAGMRPVRTPEHSVRAGLDERLRNQRSVRVVRGLVGDTVGGGKLHIG